MTYLYSFMALALLTGCSSLPSLYTSIDDIATDEAVQATVYKNAMQKDTDIRVSVDVINKDPVK